MRLVQPYRAERLMVWDSLCCSDGVVSRLGMQKPQAVPASVSVVVEEGLPMKRLLYRVLFVIMRWIAIER
jgi:hypothetical protein